MPEAYDLEACNFSLEQSLGFYDTSFMPKYGWK